MKNITLSNIQIPKELLNCILFAAGEALENTVISDISVDVVTVPNMFLIDAMNIISWHKDDDVSKYYTHEIHRLIDEPEDAE